MPCLTLDGTVGFIALDNHYFYLNTSSPPLFIFFTMGSSLSCVSSQTADRNSRKRKKTSNHQPVMPTTVQPIDPLHLLIIQNSFQIPEVLAMVLFQLPTEDLFRIRAVSTYWNDLIKGAVCPKKRFLKLGGSINTEEQLRFLAQVCPNIHMIKVTADFSDSFAGTLFDTWPNLTSLDLDASRWSQQSKQLALQRINQISTLQQLQLVGDFLSLPIVDASANLTSLKIQTKSWKGLPLSTLTHWLKGCDAKVLSNITHLDLGRIYDTNGSVNKLICKTFPGLRHLRMEYRNLNSKNRITLPQLQTKLIHLVSFQISCLFQ